MDLLLVCSEKSEEDCELGTESDPRKITALFYGVLWAERLACRFIYYKSLQELACNNFFMFSTINCLWASLDGLLRLQKAWLSKMNVVHKRSGTDVLLNVIMGNLFVEFFLEE